MSSQTVDDLDTRSPSAPRVPRLVHTVFLVNLIVEVGIIVTGGLVRLTGSGLGCPTWPQCTPGNYAPVLHEATSYHIFVEFGNRLLTGVVGIVAIAVLACVYFPLRHRRGLALPAWLVLVGIAAQAVIGGISVRVDLNPFVVGVHFIVSAGLVALASYLLYRLHEGDGPGVLLVHPLIRTMAWVGVTLTVIVLVLGTFVTGSGPHSGDAVKPARNGLDPRMISWLHADAVMLFVGVVLAVWLGCRLTCGRRGPARAWLLVLGVTLVQGVVGYTQFFSGLPWLLVLVHMLLAALMVIAVTRGMLSLRRREPVAA